MFQGDCKVLDNKVVSYDSCTMEIAYPAELIDDICAGQFLQLKATDDNSLLFKRPFGISFVDKDRTSVWIFYRVIGKNTKAMSKLKAGDTVSLIAPLGNGFDLEDEGLCLIVGGGMGVAPLYQLAKELADKGREVHSFIGFKNKEEVVYESQLAKFSESVTVSTDDGSYGNQGFVTASVRDFIQQRKYQGKIIIYSCGPKPMLKSLHGAVADIDNTVCYVSLEENMACGIGACIGCVIKTKKGSDDFKYLRVCKEGPVFNAEEIIWE